MKKIVFLVLMLIPVAVFSQLRLNEISANEGFIDGGINSDWIEITNTGLVPVVLSDYYLSDKAENPLKWQMPEVSLAPDELMLFCASNEDVTELGAQWESLVLAENQWSYFLGETAPPADWNQPGFDASPWETGAGGIGYDDGDDNTIIDNYPSVYMRLDFNVNDVSQISALDLRADYDDGFVAYLNGVEIARSSNLLGFPPAYNQYTTIDHEAGLYQGILPEVFSINQSDIETLLLDGSNTLAIQVHNANSFSSDFSSNFYLLGLIDSVATQYQPLPWWFESPGSVYSYYHTNFKISPEELVQITHSNGANEDSKLISTDLALGLTEGRSPDGTGDWCFFDVPSPGLANGNSWCYSGIATPPETLLPSGWYSGDQTIGASSADGVVRYTTNGDMPQVTDPVISQAVINSNTTISCRTFPADNLLPSAVVDRTYIFEEDNHELPVFSVHTDDDNLWDWNEGIYVFGPNAGADYPYFGSNFWEPWSKYSRVEFFNSEKQLVAEEHFDLEIHGGWSRAENQKSFRFDFKSEFTGRLETPLFRQKPFIEDFNNINIRNGGQHLWNDKCQDALFSRLSDSLNLDNMSYEPCLVYLNGDFWGVYGIREKVDEHYIESNHDIDSDQVDLVNSWGALAGSDAHLIETYNLIMAEDAGSFGFYGLVASRFDLENYMDYFIFETYIQNLDWLGIAWGINNVKLWRPQTETGKWRYVMYDTDGGFSWFWGSVFDNYIENARNPSSSNIHSQMFDKMLENEQFKCEFAQRYADIVNTVFEPSNFQAKASEITSDMTGGMELHEERWEESNSMNGWQQDVQSIVDYNSSRRTQARNHVNGSLNLGGQVTISLNVFPEGSGTIQISTITPDVYPWSGVYFDGCPVEIKAIPNEGYVFNSWFPNETIQGDFENDELLYILSLNDSFVANFSTDDSSIEEVISEASLTVYPNPNSGEFQIKYESSELEKIEMKIYNSIGVLVFSESYSKLNREFSQSIDLSSFTKGIYFLEIRSENGKLNKKVIVQ